MKPWIGRIIAAVIGTVFYYVVVQIVCLLRILELNPHDKWYVGFMLWVTMATADYNATYSTEKRIYEEQTGLR
jgi:hypothetical protein